MDDKVIERDLKLGGHILLSHVNERKASNLKCPQLLSTREIIKEEEKNIKQRTMAGHHAPSFHWVRVCNGATNFNSQMNVNWSGALPSTGGTPGDWGEKSIRNCMEVQKWDWETLRWLLDTYLHYNSAKPINPKSVQWIWKLQEGMRT